jgi:hypothetical protein
MAAPIRARMNEMVIKVDMLSKSVIMTDTAGTAGVIMVDMDIIGTIITGSGMDGDARANPEEMA